MSLYKQGIAGTTLVGQESKASIFAKLGLVGFIFLGFAGFMLYAAFYGTRPGVRIIR